MDLPPEIWMQVFENIQLNSRCARKMFSQAFADDTHPRGGRTVDTATDYYDQIEKLAVMRLPRYEPNIWSETRYMYTINRSSRAAAYRLHLSSKLSLDCRRPLDIMDFSYTGNPGTNDCISAQLAGGLANDVVTIQLHKPKPRESVVEKKLYRFSWRVCRRQFPMCFCLKEAKQVNILTAEPDLDEMALAVSHPVALRLRDIILLKWKGARKGYTGAKHQEVVMWT